MTGKLACDRTCPKVKHMQAWLSILMLRCTLLFGLFRKAPPYVDDEDDKTAKQKRQVLMSGLVTAIGIGLHNFPEGVAVFLAAYKCQALGKRASLAGLG